MSSNESANARRYSTTQPSRFNRLLLALIKFRLRKLQYGSLALTLPSGEVIRFDGSEPGPDAHIVMRDWRLLHRVIRGGHVAFGEAYVDGDWESADISRVIELFGRNTTGLSNPFQAQFPHRILNRARHRGNTNTRTGSRENISRHYDLGNDFYSEWLDPTMTYSSALFEVKGQSLQSAQESKYRRLCEAVGLTAGMKVLEIGCGWGGFAEFTAREYGASVVGATNSTRQYEYARSRIERAGLDHLVDIRFSDFRDLGGRFDAIVSIEMFEAIGEALWERYFSAISGLLKPGGKAALQIILIEEDRFGAYRSSPDFIQLHIFPGGALPTANRVVASAETSALQHHETFLLGSDYVLTLEHWERRFRRNAAAITAQGFDSKFVRKWLYYLGYCRGGFASGAINVGHFLFSRP